MPALERSILVVDDSSAMRKVVRSSLERGGIPADRILEAEDGAQALQVLEARPDQVALVLADWIMPVVDGLELLRRMRRAESLRGIPVILVTCQGSPEQVVQGMQEGARDYVVKPFRPETLLRKVQDALGIPLDTGEAAKRSVTVMVVDDSDTMRRMLKQAVLSLPTFAPTVLEAGDGVEAMALLAKQGTPVDLVLADLEMPNMDGLELLRQMRVFKHLAKVPFVMVSSSTRQDRLQQVMKEGASGVLQKPFQGATIRKKIEDLLGGREAEPLPTDVEVMRKALATVAHADLGRLPFFPQLPEPLRLALEGRGQRVTHAAGTVVCPRGAVVTRFHVIEAGEFDILAGGSEKVLEVRRAGDPFGYTSFLSGDPAVRSARARSDARVLELDRDAFNTVLHEHPYFAVFLTRLLARNAEKASDGLWSKVGVGFTGQLGMMSMVDVIQTIHGSLKTGTLRVTRGAESGEVYVIEGEVQAVLTGALEGERALHEMLRWDSGSFSFQAGMRDLKPQGLPSTMHLLMDGMRHLDEGKRDR